MSRKMMWMGTRGHEMWVPCPATPMPRPRRGWRATEANVNGGVAMYQSDTGHLAYEMAWNANSREELRKITNLAEGIYNTKAIGNPIYFIDPMAKDQNLLSSIWATPRLGALDGMPFMYDRRPTLVNAPRSDLDYPVQAAYYNAIPGVRRLKFYLPIPPGHVAWFGMHGQGDDGLMLATPQVEGLTIASVKVPMQSVDDPERFSVSFDGDLYHGVEFELGAGNGWIAGNMAQVLRKGVTPKRGPFISGQGNAGCEFEDFPAFTAYSAPLDKVGMTATLVESEPWR